MNELQPIAPPEQKQMQQASGAAAKIQAAYMVALARPRDVDAFRVRLLKECSRPGFAQAARFAKPQGGSRIEGWTIRFVEAAARLYGNLKLDSEIVFEDKTRCIVECKAIDLETNTEWSASATVSKFVERRRTMPGQEVVSTRVGASGQTLYKVVATDDDVQQRVGTAVSKLLRTLGKKLLPADILEEAWEATTRTIATDGAADPEAAKKRLIDAFSAVGVEPADLVAYLGHPLDQITPQQIVDLRGIHQAIKSGEARWTDYVETTEAIQSKTSAVKDRIRERKKDAK